jgi:hypothetical protein
MTAQAFTLTLILTSFLLSVAIAQKGKSTQTFYDSVVTKRVNSVFTIESKWLASFMISFESYQNYFDTLEHDIHSTKRLIKRYNEMFSSITLDDETKLLVSSFNMYEQRFTQLQSNSAYLRNKLNGLQSIVPHHTRSKRALFSFLGDLLSGLTGVATQSDLDLVNRRLKRMYEHNAELAHLVEESVSVMNVTQVKISEVIDSVNHLNNMSLEIQLRLRNVTRELKNELSNVRMVDFYDQHMSFHVTLLQDHLETVKTQIVHLESMLSHVFSHRVTPDVISITDLRSLLSDIQSSISPDLTLPFDINNNIVSYYEYLSCSPFIATHGVGVIITIPLLDKRSELDIYEIVNLPVPLNAQSLTVKYAINNTHIAFSKDRTSFVYLSESEFLQCTIPHTKFCHILSPARSTANHLSACDISIIHRQNTAPCSLLYQNSQTVFPYAIQVSPGYWSIVHNEEIQFVLLCSDSTNTTKLISHSPIDHLQLPIGCTASSPSITLYPTYYSQIHLNDVLPLTTPDFNDTIWNRLPQSLEALTPILPSYISPSLDFPLSLSDLSTRIQNDLSSFNIPHRSSRITTIILSSLFCLIIIIIIVVLILYFVKM